MNRKIGIVIVDGVGYRNFILSDFLNKISTDFDEIIIYSGLKKSVYNLEKYKNIKVVEIEVYRENNKVWFLRKLNETAHLYKYQSFFGMNDTLNRTKPKGYNKRAILNRIIRLIAAIFHSENNFRNYQKLIYSEFSKNYITKNLIISLKNDSPDILFFTHQRPPYIAPLVYAANVNKIKTCSFIFSWDNLASKGRIPALFDSFLVWSDLMKDELHYFYPSIEDKNVKVVGTPQFEPYVMDEYKSSIEDFRIRFNLSKFKLDTTKKIICYSCADVSIGENDGIVIEAIANAIRNHKIVEDVQLLVRTSPAEDDMRFTTIRDSFPEIYWNVPKWKLTREHHAESWSQRVPSEEDIKDLRSLLTYVDLNINMCSTMSLDFMLFDKPVINTVFGNETNGLYNDQRFLMYDHYKKVVESGAVVIAKNEGELIEAINEALMHPTRRTVQRKKLIKLQISKPLEGTSKRIVETLIQISK